MNDLKIFENEEFGEIRVTEINGEPWFVGKDVTEKLGYQNCSEALADHVDGEDKLNSKTLSSFELDLGQRGGWLINESGVYSLILSSKLPSAKKFKHWVTSEVLPAIRKTGSYSLPMNYESALEQLLVEVKKNNQLALENEELKESVVQMDRVIGEMKPKVDYCDVILSTTECMTTSQVAQDYGMSAKRFNSMLNHLGIQHRISDQWLLYSKYLGKGYTKTRVNTYKRTNGTEGSKPLTVWTQKGRMFLYEELKRYGVLPSMECEA